MKKLLLVLVAVSILAAAGASFYVQRQLQILGNPVVGLILEIPRGMSASDIVRLLAEKNVIGGRYAALAYIFYSGNRQKLQAGEYLFDRPMQVPEVVDKLLRGEVYLHRFTVPEGLTVDQIAQKWQEQGFGKTEEFISAATSAIDIVRDLDDKAASVEGYLFPETYSFPSRTTAREVVEAMIGRFRQMADRLREAVPASSWPLSLHDTVVLASLIESEAAHMEERPVIASVYLNRLKRRIRLQCDPTVIYALQQAAKYRGPLTLADLKFKSPYNTYLNAGLPPGAIANPGYPSLLAAIQPAATKYLYFVRTVESRHTFSETLAAHNRAVAAYRKSRNGS